MDGVTIPLGRLRAGLSCVLLSSLLLAACSGGAAPSPTPRPTGSAPAATVNPSSGQPADKIDEVFIQLLAIFQTQGLDPARQFAIDQGMVNKQDEARVALSLDSDDPDVVDSTALAAGRLGARITATYGNEIELVVPIPALLSYAKTKNRASFFADLADFQHVRSIHRAPALAVSGALPGRVSPGVSAAVGGKSEGVALTGADVWQAAGITGKGVRAGIIDLSFTGYKKIFPNAKVTTRSFRTDGLVEDKEPNEDTVHGTACAEIVNELAPDAELYLATVDTTGGYINAIRWMTSMGVGVMTSSVGFPGQYPLDGSSKLSQELDRAKDAGIFFAILAGNDASGTIGTDSVEGHFAAVFKDADKDGWNDFPGAKTKNGLTLRAFNGAAQIYLNWDDWKQPHVNYDLYLYDSTGKEAAHSTDNQATGLKQPLEIIRARLTAGTYTLKVKKVNPSDPDLPFNIVFRGAQLEQVTAAGSLWMPGDAHGGFTVGAISVKTDVVEDFSSQGPTQDGRKKPEIGAPDNASSFAYTLAGLSAFPGTSAATPHMAGAAALYRQAFPDASPDAIFAYFVKHVKKPKGAKTGDNITGAGRLFLDAVPQNASTRAAPTRNPSATPAVSTPTAITTPRTTPTASRPAGTPSAATTFTDDFSSSTSGLPPQGYQNGEYHLSADAGYFVSVWYPDRTVRTALSEIYEVQARRVSGASDALMGLEVRRLDKDNYLVFVIWNDGYYGAYVKYAGSLQSAFNADQPSAAIKQDGANMLRVTAQGTQFEFAANGQPLFRVTVDNLWTEGLFGIVGGGGDKTMGEVAFDNYRLTTG